MPFGITPASCVGQSLKAVYDLVVSLESAHNFLGVADAAAADARVHVMELPDSSKPEQDEHAEWLTLNPYILIMPPDESFLLHETYASGGYAINSFQWDIAFSKLIADGDTRPDSLIALQLMDDVGRVIEELLTPGNNLWASEVSADSGPLVVSARDQQSLGRLAQWMCRLSPTTEEPS